MFVYYRSRFFIVFDGDVSMDFNGFVRRPIIVFAAKNFSSQ